MSTRSLGFSAALHLLIFLLVVFGLPYFQTETLAEPQVITVELLPMSDKSNAPNMVKTQKPKKPTPPKKVEQPPKPKKEEVKKPDPKPAPKKETPKEEVKKAEPLPKKEEVKKEEKKEEKPKKEEPKKDDQSFDDLLKNLEKEAPKASEKAETPDEAPVAEGDKDIKSDQFDPSAQISASEKDAIRNQIMKCWNPPLGSKDAGNLIPILKVKYRPDGSVEQVFLSASQNGRYSGDSAFRAAADSAIRAVQACQPLKDMPQEKYQGWKDVELTFDPRDML